MCISAVISFHHLTEQVSVIDARIEKNLIRRVQDKISNSNQITVLFSRWKTYKRNDIEIGVILNSVQNVQPSLLQQDFEKLIILLPEVSLAYVTIVVITTVILSNWTQQIMN